MANEQYCQRVSCFSLCLANSPHKDRWPSGAPSRRSRLLRRTTCQRWDCEPCRQSTADSWTGLLEAARLSSAAVRGFLRALMGCEGCQGLSPYSPGTALVGDSLGTAPCRRLCCKFAAGLLRPRPSGGGKPRPGCAQRLPLALSYTLSYTRCIGRSILV